MARHGLWLTQQGTSIDEDCADSPPTTEPHLHGLIQMRVSSNLRGTPCTLIQTHSHGDSYNSHDKLQQCSQSQLCMISGQMAPIQSRSCGSHSNFTDSTTTNTSLTYSKRYMGMASITIKSYFAYPQEYCQIRYHSHLWDHCRTEQL